MYPSPVKSLGAVLPLVMPFATLGMVAGHAVVFGIVHETDEGAAHIFQLLMAAQVPGAVYLAIKWLPRGFRDGPCR